MKRCAFEARLVQVKDVLPLAEEILRYGITISELLALHSAAVEKAEEIVGMAQMINLDKLGASL